MPKTPDNVSVSTVDISNIMPQDPAAAPAPVEEGTPAPVVEDAAVAPVVEPAALPADAPTELSLDVQPATKVDVASTGIEAFDVVGNMLGEKGVANANEIMDAFLEAGELSLEHKAQMIEALGEGVASMAFKSMESQAATLIGEAQAETAASMDYANTKFGGENAEQTWKEIQAYVRTPESGFSEADLASMNTMLEAGGLQAQLVIDRVHATYNADPGNSVPGNLLEGDSVNTGLTFEPISRADYTAEMSTAVRKYGEDSHQVNELNRRRTLSMSRGI